MQGPVKGFGICRHDGRLLQRPRDPLSQVHPLSKVASLQEAHHRTQVRYTIIYYHFAAQATPLSASARPLKICQIAFSNVLTFNKMQNFAKSLFFQGGHFDNAKTA